MALVLRSHYGNESIALIQWMYEQREKILSVYQKVYVAYIETGWEAASWKERAREGEAWVRSLHFTPLWLVAPSFETLVKDRGSFPSAKFQWCAGFLKGLPLLNWLEEVDLNCEWTIAISKRQALYRTPISEWIQECPYHGERAVWHPLLSLTTEERDLLIQRAGFSLLSSRSLECEPCVYSTKKEWDKMHPQDRKKVAVLSTTLKKPWDLFYTFETDAAMARFERGCGDHFGCGL